MSTHMPEQKLGYEERVDKAAETYANSYNSYVDLLMEYKHKSDFQYEGKKAIAAQAEAIREILLLFFNPKYLDVDKLLLEHGYIEPKTESNV